MSMVITDKNVTDLIKIYGKKLKYYSGRLCSCVGESGTPQLKCTCNLGYRYELPEEIWGIRQKVSSKILNTPAGRIYDGGAQFTIPKFYKGILQKAFYKLSHGDIICIEGKYKRDSDVLLKGTRDRLFAFDVQEIISVSQLDVEYRQGIDFEMDGVSFVWLNGGNKPEEESYYSVEYTSYQQYKVWDDNGKDRGAEGDDLPNLVYCVNRRYIDKINNNPLDNVEL